jgi:CyaY protein
MERSAFLALSSAALEHIDAELGDLEHESMDIDLGGDVLTIAFSDGTKFIINAHSAAGQVWMAADKTAWHFDWEPEHERWIAKKTGDELMATVAAVVGAKLGTSVRL